MMQSFTNNIPILDSEIEAIEKCIYDTEVIPDNTTAKNVNFDIIAERPVAVFRDKTFNMPQNIFIIKNFKNGVDIVGRKIISNLFLNKKINAVNCSKISASMILGILICKIIEGSNISIKYYPLEKSEKISIFSKIAKDRGLNIEFPFRYKDFITNKEKQSPICGWSINEKKAVYLGEGEAHIREYIINYLNQNGLVKTGTAIFDPACSTGQFLYELKKEFPKCTTIGQDLSQDMVDYAKSYVDSVYCGDSIQPKVMKNSVDILLLRFLNSEVVTTVMAHRLFNSLIGVLRSGGVIFCFGHTPVLIRLKYFLIKKLDVIHTNGYSIDDNSVFQLYILKKV